jgi:hypothetical protein
VLKLITVTPLELLLVVVIAGLLNAFNGGQYGINTGLFMGLVVLPFLTLKVTARDTF